MATKTATRAVGLVATVLRVVGMAIVAFLALHIVLTLLDANPQTWLVELVSGIANAFNLGLSNLFTPDEPKIAVLLNYGTAALLWLLITAVVVRLVSRLG